jgi:hypothetical protein
VTAVLFGAPLSMPASLSTSPLTLSTAGGGGAPETLLFAAHLALLAGQPLVYTRGVDPEAWRLAGALALPLDDVMGGAVGALLGAWFGAVPIPLDWWAPSRVRLLQTTDDVSAGIAIGKGGRSRS